MFEKIEREALSNDPTLEEVLRSEIKYLEMKQEAHASAADGFRQKANELRSLLGQAGIKTK